MDTIVYLDHNATSPVRPAVAEAHAHALSLTGNVSSVHRCGRMVRRLVEDARDKVAALVGADAANVVFTSGGTEANNLALRGFEGRVLVSAVEHPSVLKAVDDPEVVPVDGNGIVDVDALESMLAADDAPALVSVMLANNETGVIQPIAAVVEAARRHNALVHCDTVQGAGKIAFDMASLGVDMLSLSAHKIGGPPGIGALVIGEDMTLRPQMLGGGQERGRRAGTENAAGIAGFGVAADLAASNIDSFSRLSRLRDGLEDHICKASPKTRVFGAGVERLPNTSFLTMPEATGEAQVIALDLDGVAISAGSACTSGKTHASHVLKAMGVDDDEASRAIRVSLGWTTTQDDIDRFLKAWGLFFARTGANKSSAA